MRLDDGAGTEVLRRSDRLTWMFATGCSGRKKSEPPQAGPPERFEYQTDPPKESRMDADNSTQCIESLESPLPLTETRFNVVTRGGRLLASNVDRKSGRAQVADWNHAKQVDPASMVPVDQTVAADLNDAGEVALYRVQTHSGWHTFVSKQEAESFSAAYGHGCDIDAPQVFHHVVCIDTDGVPVDRHQADSDTSADVPSPPRSRAVQAICDRVAFVAERLPSGVILEEPAAVAGSTRDDAWLSDFYCVDGDHAIDCRGDIAEQVAEIMREQAQALLDAADDLDPQFHQGRLAVVSDAGEVLVLGPRIDGPCGFEVLVLGEGDPLNDAGDPDGWNVLPRESVDV